jgi:iron complex transport system ATP-binding protein
MLETQALSFSYRTQQVLREVTLHAGPSLTTVIGPNAAGKSTLINCLAGMLRTNGAVLVEERPLRQWKKRDLSRILGYMPQHSDGKALLTVMETVLLGRLGTLSLRVGDEDLEMALGVLRELGIEHLCTRPLDELSGGQQQLVSIAQVLVKQPRILLMDEPTNNLDLFRQMELFECIRRLTAGRDLTTVMALHDLNFACRFSDRIIVLHEGEVFAAGTPREILTESMLLHVYCIEAKVVHDDSGIPQIIPIRPLPRQWKSSDGVFDRSDKPLPVTNRAAVQNT